MSNLQIAFLGFGLALVVYFFPAAVAFMRSHHNRVAILVLNIFLGWTGIGWIGALVWALMNPPPSPATTAAEPLDQRKEPALNRPR